MQVDLNAMASTLGVPVKLLHEAMGHIITVELKTGQLYRGKLLEGAYVVTRVAQLLTDSSQPRTRSISRSGRSRSPGATGACPSWTRSTFAAAWSGFSSCPTCSKTRRCERRLRSRTISR